MNHREMVMGLTAALATRIACEKNNSTTYLSRKIILLRILDAAELGQFSDTIPCILDEDDHDWLYNLGFTLISKKRSTIIIW